MIDSNLLIAFLKGIPEAVEKIRKLITDNNPIFISSISIYEVYLGIIANLYLKEGRPAKVPDLLASYKKLLLNCNIVDLTQESAEKSAEIYAQLQGKGIVVREKDCLIAGIALVHGISEVITRDESDFKKIYEIAGLRYSGY